MHISELSWVLDAKRDMKYPKQAVWFPSITCDTSYLNASIYMMWFRCQALGCSGNATETLQWKTSTLDTLEERERNYIYFDLYGMIGLYDGSATLFMQVVVLLFCKGISDHQRRLETGLSDNADWSRFRQEESGLRTRSSVDLL